MAKFVSNKNETVRLFKNPFLEYFSHIHPATPIVIYVPIMIMLSYFGFRYTGIAAGIMCFILGVILWSLTEYVIHRWAFHYPPKTDIGKKMHFLVHGIHHDYPRDATRLVMPLLVSLPLAIIFYLIFEALFGIYHFEVFSGFMLGYVSYDSIHYATHHLDMKGRIGKFLKTYHLRHHYADENTAYGVSNPMWDYVFGTVPQQVKDKKHSKPVIVGK